jgi:hypothetical protein
MSCRCSNLVALAAVLCLMPAGAIAQRASITTTTKAEPEPSGSTPRTPDGHPDLSGVWALVYVWPQELNSNEERGCS